MLDAIKNLGSYVIENGGLSEEGILVQDAKLKNTKKMFCIVFEQKDDDVIYDSVHLEDYDTSKSGKYLYRTFQHGRYDVTPTTRILSPDKVKQRTFLWFEKYSKEYSNDLLIQSLNMEIHDKGDEIFKNVSEKYNSLDKTEKRNSILTIKIKKEGKEKYLGDDEVFRDIFKKEALKKFFFKHDVESRGIGICCLCRKKGEVLGFAFPFSFYTLDKKGFAPDFLREDAWKRLPICMDCAISLAAGREFLDNYLLKRFYGFSFYVIPNFIFEIQEDIIDDIKNSDSDKRKYSESLLCIEDDILVPLIKERKDVLNLIFMFIKPKQKDFFDIIQYVEDVPPSWIKKLYDTLKEIERLSLFKEESLKKIFGEKWAGDSKELFKGDTTIGGLIRTFFPSSKYTGIYDKYFVDIVGDILAQRPIDRDLLVKAFMREIRTRHVEERTWDEKVYSLKSLMLILFLEKLGEEKCIKLVR